MRHYRLPRYSKVRNLAHVKFKYERSDLTIIWESRANSFHTRVIDVDRSDMLLAEIIHNRYRASDLVSSVLGGELA